MAEVAFSIDGIGNRFMKNMFGAVVQGQGATTGGRELAQPVNDGLGGFYRSFPGQFGQEHEAALAFGECIEGGSTLPGDQRIPFPVTEPGTGRDHGRTVIDGNPVRNLRPPLLPAQPFLFPFPVRPPQTPNKRPPLGRGRVIDVLVDCFYVCIS